MDMKNEPVDIWFDFSNPPHVNLFRPLLKHFTDKRILIFATAKDFVETRGLLNKYEIKYETFGRHGGKKRLLKFYNLLNRNYLLLRGLPKFKISISSSFEAPQISWLRQRPAIIFDDNEIAPNWLYAKFAKFVISPKVIDIEAWQKSGINKKKVIRYSGFKEDIYIADYKPDKNFLDHLPFDKFITVRPENIFAAYVPKNVISIVPELIKSLSKQDFNILYLPRYEIDKTYVNNQSNIYIPDQPLNGLDVCYYSDAVLTGAGTFAREAAVMSTPAVSFFAGNQLLTVDKSMIENKMVYHSRSINNIINYLNRNPKEDRKPSLNKCKKVQKEVIEILDNIVLKYI